MIFPAKFCASFYIRIAWFFKQPETISPFCSCGNWGMAKLNDLFQVNDKVIIQKLGLAVSQS